jgi:class 3 adenylate cyclase
VPTQLGFRRVAPPQVSVGIASGMTVSGVAGWKKQQFSLFGDCVNTASRMQSCAQPLEVRVEKSTYDLAAESVEAMLAQENVKAGSLPA